MSPGAVILQQLGGNRFIAMTGAMCLDTGDGLQIKLPRISKLSCVRIDFDAGTDTYTVQGYKGRGLNIREAGEALPLVYADMLRRLFTSMTGLEVTL